MWTDKDRKIVLTAKKNHPRWSWEKIVMLCEDAEHSSSSCRQMYQRMETDGARRSTPLQLHHRRAVAKMRLKSQPVPWEEVAEAVGFSIDDCKNFIAYHMTENEEKRGKMEGIAEQRRVEMLEQRRRQQHISKGAHVLSNSQHLLTEKSQKKPSVASDNESDMEQPRTAARKVSPSVGSKVVSSTGKKKLQVSSINSSEESSSDDEKPSVHQKVKKSTTAPDSPSRHNKGWSEQEERKLVRYYNKNLTWSEIAKMLDRTSDSCRSKFYRITVPVDEKN